MSDGVLNTGDYVYEPSGVLHDATTALEDTTYLFICNGAVLFFDENGFTRYANWEVMGRLRRQTAGAVSRRGRGIGANEGSSLRVVRRARGLPLREVPDPPPPGPGEVQVGSRRAAFSMSTS